MSGTDTYDISGEEIRAGDLVRAAAWTGVVVFVLATGSFAAGYDLDGWSYLGRG